ncbi:hypothetical protein [Spirosoma oryzicola]|uniref:hypothetical protein n=1 Tax=Spirosoma oryzicola TaxID=2898794 RepID=UPI001E4AD266|nr:hypothetical protein [Spirosoma oryzicola]UHG94720.1 hypothetical protein LQ777_28680 [Spirosoma oryzicola]
MKKYGNSLWFGVVLLWLSSCSSRLTFLNSTVTPAATGTVSFKKDKNSNYILQVEVRNLAEPHRLTPSKNIYLAWMEAGGRPAQKLGQLTIYSKMLKGELKATTIDQPAVVYITAEVDENAESPGEMVVLTTKR